MSRFKCQYMHRCLIFCSHVYVDKHYYFGSLCVQATSKTERIKGDITHSSSLSLDKHYDDFVGFVYTSFVLEIITISIVW